MISGGRIYSARSEHLKSLVGKVVEVVCGSEKYRDRLSYVNNETARGSDVKPGFYVDVKNMGRFHLPILGTAPIDTHNRSVNLKESYSPFGVGVTA